MLEKLGDYSLLALSPNLVAGYRDERKLLYACDQATNPMLAWMTRMALHTGMRAGEIQTLHRDQIDLDRRVILLTKTKNGSARLVPLTKAATEVARAALQHSVRPMDTDLVF